MRRSRSCFLPPILVLGLVAIFAGRAWAFEGAGSLDGIDYQVICTDLAQLKEKINVLVILSRQPGAAGGKKTVRVALDIPAEAFKAKDDLEVSLELEPGELKKRFAFKGLLALKEADPGKFLFELRISTGKGAPEVLRFEVVAIRGPLPPRGLLSILYPTLVSLLFLPVFVLFLRRRGEPGGWRAVKDAEIDAPEEAWWEMEEPAAEPEGEGAS